MSRAALRLCWTALWCGLVLLASVVFFLRRDLAEAREEMRRLRKEVDRLRHEAVHNGVDR